MQRDARTPRLGVALLCLLLLPLLVITSSAQLANAAVTYGGAKALRFDFAGLPRVGGGYVCAATVYYAQDGARTSLKTKGAYCKDGWVSAWKLDGGRVTLAFTGTTDTGGTCLLSLAATTTQESNGDFTWPTSETTGQSNGCSVTSVCWSVTGASNIFDEHAEGCQPFDMEDHPEPITPEPEPDPAKTCAVGNFRPTGARVTITGTDTDHTTARENWHMFKVELWHKGTIPDGYQLLTYPLNQDNDSAALYWWYLNGGNKTETGVSSGTPYAVRLPVRAGVGHLTSDPAEHLHDGGAPASQDKVGLQVYLTGPSPYNEGANFGKNDPVRCRWYLGKKTWNDSDPTLTLDDPQAPLLDPTGTEPPPEEGTPAPEPEPLPPPADDEPTCTFVLSDPGTWLSAGMCAAVGLLGAIWETLKAALGVLAKVVAAILGLPAAILDGLGGIFEYLFVPSEGFLDAEMTSLRNAWRDTTLGAYLGAITGQTVDFPAGNCNGIDLRFNLAGIDVNTAIGEACTGQMARSAGIVKGVVTALLVIFGGLGCVRALGSGFGWSPGIGRGTA